jgi:hypothetical protein
MSVHPASGPATKKIEDFQARIQEQKARLQRMIAQGTIAQSDDDLLHEMYATLKKMQAARLRTSG